jgi:hypothetical protein
MDSTLWDTTADRSVELMYDQSCHGIARRGTAGRGEVLVSMMNEGARKGHPSAPSFI